MRNLHGAHADAYSASYTYISHIRTHILKTARTHTYLRIRGARTTESRRHPGARTTDATTVFFLCAAVCAQQCVQQSFLLQPLVGYCVYFMFVLRIYTFSAAFKRRLSGV